MSIAEPHFLPTRAEIEAATLNVYRNVDTNPTNCVDPTGLSED